VIHFGQRVLACAPSNVAVDNIVERLVQYNSVINGMIKENKSSNNSNNNNNNKKKKNSVRRPLKICRLGHPGKH